MAKLKKRESGYTMVNNHMFRDKELSLKGKGLLALMLSLPNNWEFSIEGLAVITKEGRDSVASGVKELETLGYLKRTRVRDKNGVLQGNDYFVNDSPTTGFPTLDNPAQENPTQLNKEEVNKEKDIKGEPSPPPSPKKEKKKKGEDVAADIAALPKEATKIYFWFLDLIPESITKNLTLKDQYSWTKTIADLCLIDHHNYIDICKVIKWARADHFWQDNFKSLTKLRKKDDNKQMYFDRFKELMLKDQQPKEKKQQPTYVKPKKKFNYGRN